MGSNEFSSDEFNYAGGVACAFVSVEVSHDLIALIVCFCLESDVLIEYKFVGLFGRDLGGDELFIIL